MNKLLLFFAILTLVVYSQPPPGPGNGNNNNGAPPAPEDTPQEDQASMMTIRSSKPPEEWYCDIEFYYNGKPYFYESLSYDEAEAYKGSFSKKYDNKIDEIYWSGTRCYCWVVVYQSKYFKGLNLGLWTDSNDGSYDLSKYITYDFYDKAWEPWDKTVSSYSIYCY